MLHDSTLRRAADKVASYIHKNVTLAGVEEKEEVFELFDRMHQFFPHWVILTCPVMHPDIHYASQNALFVFGYNTEEMINNCSIEKFFSFVHEDDKADLFSCYNHLHNLLEGISPDEHKDYRAVFHYRFRKSNGEYMYLLDERATLTLRGSGNLYFGLDRDITQDRPFSGVKLELFKQEETIKKIEEYKPSSLHIPLSKREMELVGLIKQGLSTKEIAWQLNISHNTVRNIKSRMFEKFRVNNTIELLNMTA